MHPGSLPDGQAAGSAVRTVSAVPRGGAAAMLLPSLFFLQTGARPGREPGSRRADEFRTVNFRS